VGTRYFAALPADDVSDLPSPARIAIQSSITAFLTQDRGHVRQGNDGTADSRFVFFARWLDKMQFTQQSAAALTKGQTIQLLGAYLTHLRHGATLQQSTTIVDQTLRGYIGAAANVFTVLTKRRCLAYDPATLHQRQPSFHPFLREQLTQRANWRKPRDRIEPFTSAMFEVLFQEITSSTDPSGTFISPLHSIFDWTRLGLFTGSRLGEYGQSRRTKGSRYNTVPQSIDAGAWAGSSIAFIAADFTFFTAELIAIPHEQVPSAHARAKVSAIQIRFRYDKSKDNFTIRKFRSLDHPFLDPVDAGVSILRRAHLLRVPLDEPLGVYASPLSSSFSFITAKTVTEVMHHACVVAYPDPQHQLRRNIKSLVAHSNRVTAAVCLQQGGASNDEIAFRLRWQPASVPIYLRDCFQAVGDTLQKALVGAYRSM
jgi:hypothetical protein